MFKQFTDRLLSEVEGVFMREASKALAPHIEEAAEGIMEAVFNSAPTIRSTGGATSVCLTKVRSDFKDFHAEDADTDIQTFVLELIQVQHGMKDGFEKAKVSDKVAFNMSGVTDSPVADIKINNIAISDYRKSLNSATLFYRVSVGYNSAGMRHEKLYEIEYTLQLRTEYGEDKFLECKHCGAPLKESSGECEYCGMKHIRDTILNWVVTDYKLV